MTAEQFVRAVNKVEPSLIRTQADELTYSLHVLIRYEIEKMLIEENLEVEKPLEIWADKYEEYLGVRPEDVSEGVLQDIHWSQGAFGYFPSYALGSAFGAQLYRYMKGQMDFEGSSQKRGYQDYQGIPAGEYTQARKAENQPPDAFRCDRGGL